MLLAVNCGFGNSDCGTLPLSAIDLKGCWINCHRPKTGVNRRCPLWPETVTAIKAALASRPEPIRGDTLQESDEYFNVMLTGSNVANFSNYGAYGNILDDDTPPEPMNRF